MPDMAKTIRDWFGRRSATEHDAFEEQAARNLLQDHIDSDLLEAFLRRDVDDEDHQLVIGHLNGCDQCREAIAIVLLALDDPKAAAELTLERKRRLEGDSEVWWKQALRWSVLAILALVLFLSALLIPKSKDSDSPVGRWFEQADNSVGRIFGTDTADSSSSTTFGQMFSSTYDVPKPEPPPVRGRVIGQAGWDTGAAPYAGNVSPSAPYKEIDFPSEGPSSPERSTATGPASSDNSAPRTSSDKGAKAAPRPARRRLLVSPEGELKRTLDGGATWQTVNVGSGLAFRALALSGHSVWAAGDAGALYRSEDAAEHWQQVQIHHRGEPIKEDIVDIRFTDPQHGTLRTASEREWTTVDGGNKWVFNPFTANAK
jgi:hypothetical protein